MNVTAADPFVLYDKKSNCYYCYATSNELSPIDKTFFIYRSFDGLNWEFVDYALDLSHPDNWGKDWFWAPEVYYNEHNGYYYMFYSARLKDKWVKSYFYDENYVESCKIGVAVSRFPEGPFINLQDRPLDYYPYDKQYVDVDKYCKNPFLLKDDKILQHAEKGIHFPIIDANLFFDEEKIYLFYSRCCYKNCLFDPQFHQFIEESQIACVELNTDWWFTDGLKMPTIKNTYLHKDAVNNQRQDSYQTIIHYQNQPQNWENAHINDYEKTGKNRRWSEGSTVFTIQDRQEKYYAILYSCNFFENPNYGVGIAFSSHPLGPYQKYPGNPIIHQKKEEHLFSTGHGSLVTCDDKLYYYFHGRDSLTSLRWLYRCEIVIRSKAEIKIENIVKCHLNSSE